MDVVSFPSSRFAPFHFQTITHAYFYPGTFTQYIKHIWKRIFKTPSHQTQPYQLNWTLIRKPKWERIEMTRSMIRTRGAIRELLSSTKRAEGTLQLV